MIDVCAVGPCHMITAGFFIGRYLHSRDQKHDVHKYGH